MTSPTILECLDLRHYPRGVRLPNFPDADPNRKKEASELGESTKKAAPPHFAIHNPSQYSIGIGQSILDHITAVIQRRRTGLLRMPQKPPKQPTSRTPTNAQPPSGLLQR